MEVIFLRKLDLFEDCPRALLNSFINSFEKLKFNSNHCLYKENDPVDYMYIIQSGEIMISQMINLDD